MGHLKFAFFIFIVYWMFLDVTFASFESNLKEYLFNNQTYDPSVRPQNRSSILYVKIDIALRQVIEMDERNQILFSSLWYRWRWTDAFLKWNPDDFGGLKVFRITPDKVWTPDIVLYNDVREEVRDIDLYEVFVYSTGDVQWNFPMLIKSACKVDVLYFPYDQQICPLKFGSWAYDGFLIDIMNKNERGDNTTFTKNGEFELIDIRLRRHVKIYQCCPEPYPDVTFYIILRRKSMFVMYNLVLPCIVVTLITMMGFFLPADSGEKISLGITTLLALFVFLLLVAESMPPQSDVVPLIGKFFVAIIVLLTISLLATVCILNMYFRGQHGNEMPEMLKNILFNSEREDEEEYEEMDNEGNTVKKKKQHITLARILFMTGLVKNLKDEEAEIKKCHEQMKKLSIAAVASMAKFKALAQKKAAEETDDAETASAKPSSNGGGGWSALLSKARQMKVSPNPNPEESTDDETATAAQPPATRARMVLPNMDNMFSSSTMAKNKELRNLREVVEKISGKIEIFEKLQLEKERTNHIESEWRLGALLVDRLLLIIFFMANLIISLVFLLITPNYEVKDEVLDGIS